jgi:hypothetical protein
VKKFGQMGVIIKGSIGMVRNMEKASSPGLMGQLTLEIGKLIKCMDKEFSDCQMAECTKANTKTTANMEKECSLMQMEEKRKVFGRMGNK